jgi:RHS repeat-associated protein
MCVQAYRWNLDYVVDPSDNTMTYFYNTVTNNYGGINNTLVYGYTQSAQLDHIEYGTRKGSEAASPAPFKVTMTLANRCQGACTYPVDFVDSPMDLQCWSATSCPNNVSPTFFSFYRMAVVSTFTYRGGGYKLADKWDFAHRYPATPGEQPNLWLDSITHTGYADDGSTGLAEPAVLFGDVSLANRVPGGAGAQNVHQRVAAIENGTGGRTNVTYSGVDCPQYVAAFNPHRCYPQYTSVQAGDPASWQWFNKFVVSQVDDLDMVGGSPAETWKYTYGTTSAIDGTLWAHDQAEMSKTRGWSRWMGYPDVSVTHGSGSDGTKLATTAVFYRGLYQDATMHPDGVTPLWDTRFRQAAIVAPLGNVPSAQGNIAGTGGRCLNISTNGTTNGLPVTLWDCDGRAANIWWYDYSSQTLRNTASGRCLDVTGGATANGTRVELWDCNYGAGQQWRWGPEGTLINPNSGRCLDAIGYSTANGTALQIWDCNTGPNQIFTARNDGQIQSQQSRRCIDLIGGASTAGTKAGTGFCALTTARQTWQFNPTSTPGQGTISNPAGGNCLEIETGNLLQINPCTSATGQLWEPQPNGTIKNPGTGLCIDATADPTPGERLTVATCTGSLTQQWAHQTADQPGFAGQTRQATTLDGAAVVSSAINTYSQTQTGIRAKPDPASDNVYARRVLPVRTQTKTFLSWNTTWRWTDTQTTYDATYPNLVSQVKDLGDTSTTADDVCSTTTYNTNPGAMLIAFPKETLTTTCGIVSGDGDILGGQHFYYDGATTDTAPTKGLPTKTMGLKQVASGAKTWIQTGRSTYDIHGRATESYDALDRKTTTAYTPATGGPVTSIKATNPLGHFSSTTLNHRGQPLTVTDPNSKLTTGTYDPLGRLVKVWKPGHPTNGTPDAEYAYVLQTAAASYTIAKTLGPNANQITSYEYYDGRLRARQSQTTAPDGKRVVSDTKYDSRGLAVKSATFYNNTAMPLTTPAMVSYADTSVDSQTRNTFDGAGRQLTSELWSLNALKWKTTNVYNGDRIGTTPPTGGTATTTINNARGKTTTLRQHEGGTLGGAYISTSYTYDRAGLLTKVTDPAANQWLYEYDLLGRKTKSTDPDAGISTTVYDNAGQVTSTTDARSQQLWFEYDVIGRKTKTRADTAAGTVLSSAVYDTVQKGQLTSATRHDASGDFISAVSSYNDAYQPLTTTLTAPGFGTSGGTLTYSVASTYKTNGAPATSSLPAVGGLPAETLTYTYTDTGLIKTLYSGQAQYVADTWYHYDGLIAAQTMGTGGKQALRQSNYDLATRLVNNIKISTETATPGTFAEKFGSFYTYDNAGNITSIAGTTNAVGDQQECFRYDHLRRMTEAWTNASWNCAAGPQKTGADPYWRTWTFDSIGNRLTQTDKNTDGTTSSNWASTIGTAGSVKPHQVSKVDATGPLAGTPTRTFTYDNTGNTATRQTETGVTQTLEWDKENHLAAVKEGTTTVASYIYDPAGQRLVGTATNGGTTKTTLYLPDGTELEKTAGGAILGQRYIGGVALRDAAGLKWTISNHQATHSAQIDATTLAVTQRRMMPYGETRGTPPTWLGSKGYVGGTKDTPTGLTHLGAREYDPSTGRFISVDPVMDLADPQQWNPYTYSNNSPVTSSDPSGLLNKELDSGGLGGCGTLDACRALNYGEPVGYQTVLTNGTIVRKTNGRLYINNRDVTNGFQSDSGSRRRGAPGFWNFASEFDAWYGQHNDHDGDITDPNVTGAAIAAAQMDGAFTGYSNNSAAPWHMWALGQSNEGAEFIAAAGSSPMITVGPIVGFKGPRGTGGGCNSFAPATLVLLADGTTKQIKDIALGDDVLAGDPETGETDAKEVTGLIFGEGVKDLVELTVIGSDGKIAAPLVATANHPFWTTGISDAWLPASGLKPGTWLKTSNGAWVQVSAVRKWSQWASVHNLTIADLHTYYVLAGSIPVLVHNCPSDEPMGPQKGNTPGNNQAQNRAFRDAVRAIEHEIGRPLTKAEQRELHDEITGQGYGYHEIIEEGVALFE